LKKLSTKSLEYSLFSYCLMDACFHKNVHNIHNRSESELFALGYEDTDTSELEKRREWEDYQLDRTYTDLPRFLAEKSRLRNLRHKEDKEHAKRKERRAALKAWVEKKKSTMHGIDDFDRAWNEIKDEKKAQYIQSVGFVKSKPEHSGVSRPGSTNAKLTPEQSEISGPVIISVKLTPEISEVSRPVTTTMSEDNVEDDEAQSALLRLIDIDTSKMI